MKLRLIGRLDIKNNRLIKGVHLEGLRVVGDPLERALSYYQQGIDELLLVDAVASLYQRNHLSDIVRKICEQIFIPVTVGGGIRSVEDAKLLFDSGADKVAINTAALDRPQLLSELSERFGAQAVVLSVQAKRDFQKPSLWMSMSDNGRENSGRNVLHWVREAQKFGIGEILVTSIDQEGTSQGYDISLLKALHDSCNCPILASGGFGKPIDALNAHAAGSHAIVIAGALHYGAYSVAAIKTELKKIGLSVRGAELFPSLDKL